MMQTAHQLNSISHYQDVKVQQIYAVHVHVDQFELLRSDDRDGYPCVYVRNVSDYYNARPDPALLRLTEDHKILWGDFYTRTKRIEKEINGELFYTQRTALTEWRELKLDEKAYTTLLPILRQLLGNS